MSWDGRKLPFNRRELESIKAYMAARLSGGEKTPPPFFASRGDCPEDFLVQYARHGVGNEEELGLFWSAWHDVMVSTYQNRELTAFQNGISLACQLPPPAEVEAMTDFLPRQADRYDWGMASDHPFQQALLKLFLTWNIIPEGDPFWRAAFRGYLSAANNQGDSRPSLIGAYNGIGLLTPEDYQLLLAYVARCPSDHAKRQYQAIMEDQEYRFGISGAAAELPSDAFREGMANYLMATLRSDSTQAGFIKTCTITRDVVMRLTEERQEVYTPLLIRCDRPYLNPIPKSNPNRHHRVPFPC